MTNTRVVTKADAEQVIAEVMAPLLERLERLEERATAKRVTKAQVADAITRLKERITAIEERRGMEKRRSNGTGKWDGVL